MEKKVQSICNVSVLTAGVSPPRVFLDFPPSSCYVKQTNKQSNSVIKNISEKLLLLVLKLG